MLTYSSMRVVYVFCLILYLHPILCMRAARSLESICANTPEPLLLADDIVKANICKRDDVASGVIYTHYHNSNLTWRTVSRRVDEVIPSDHPRRVASRVIQWYSLIHETDGQKTDSSKVVSVIGI